MLFFFIICCFIFLYKTQIHKIMKKKEININNYRYPLEVWYWRKLYYKTSVLNRIRKKFYDDE